MVGLIDCDVCFCSCEKVFRPDLANKPVVVLSNNDGCVVARSKEVKAMGIPDCMPLGKKAHHPISKKTVDFSKTPEYKFRVELMEALKQKRKVALRVGTLKDNGNWEIRPSATQELLKGKKTIAELTEDDVFLSVR